MNIIKAPDTFSMGPRPWVFLAGSIEMGATVNWQKIVEQALADQSGTLLNPRRDDWDASWIQDMDNPQFYEQVTWELNAQDEADLILIHFEPDTKSPITLLELGLAGHNKKAFTLVHCPKGFWRKVT